MCIITHRGLRGKDSLNDERKILSGKILDIPEMIPFEGSSIQEVEKDFYKKAEKYIEINYRESLKDKKYLDGRINLKIEPHLHKSIQVVALCHGMVANEYIEKLMYDDINRP